MEFENNRTKTNTIFNIIGAPDAAANLLCEFKIAAKNDAKQIKNTTKSHNFIHHLNKSAKTCKMINI